MPRAKSNGIELEYDTFGSPGDPALLLVMGLGAQMTLWRPEFCAALADRGFFVVRYDNRDAGLSTGLDEHPVPDIGAVLSGDHSGVPYLLADMADDAVGLLDALDIRAAHVVGASMGGMIAQQLVIDHPDRVLSLCSVMSTTGDRSVGRASAAAIAAMPGSNGVPLTREAVIDEAVRRAAVIGSPAYPPAPEELRERVTAAYDRAYRPEGYVRQYAAILASPDRTPGLRSVTVPTVVVHGEEDPLVDHSGGRATAAAVPGSELLLIPGMGHDLPEQVWPAVVDAIARNAARGI
ncbi:MULTISPECIES: alpha/beta fold hydrolase [unclassified Streptomyces]|uniref:alpha/beta fold hydrolase n=1 Tax=unclassified Streptomyces TaxID=2593676 RepID=UPI00036935AB|nr:MULTISPECIES: alpha/beta fold hydrolase [unclassified Streptomyces]MYX33168.1 alpha/beta fold hydrolase [Streptomyces sp. SID8377]